MRGAQINVELEFWNSELGPTDSHAGKKIIQPIGGINNWYNKADEYWSSVEPTVNGVLGGLDFLNDLDIEESNKFLQEFYKIHNGKKKRALDCGAGIGRITQNLLVNWFEEIDLIDQCQNYINKAREQLSSNPKVKEFYVGGLQNFTPIQKYDCIWIQWVASHLTDLDLIEFLRRSADNLNENGFIFVKENICSKGFIVDKEDFSVTRSDVMFKSLFEQANLRLVMQRLQPDFPKDLFKVNQYALIVDR